MRQPPPLRSSSTTRDFLPDKSSSWTSYFMIHGPVERGGLQVSSGKAGRDPQRKRTDGNFCPTGLFARGRRQSRRRLRRRCRLSPRTMETQRSLGGQVVRRATSYEFRRAKNRV